MSVSEVDITVEQIKALFWLEEDDEYDVSRAVGRNREIKLQFTRAPAGRHLYVQLRGEQRKEGTLLVTRDGEIIQCEGAFP